MAKFFNSRAADEIVKQTRRLRDNPVATDALRLPVRIGGSRRKFGKLDADLATDDTTGVTVSIYSGDTDTGSDVDGVLLAPWIEADLNSGDWVEVIEWGGESYALPVAVAIGYDRCTALAKGDITGTGTKTVDNVKATRGKSPLDDPDDTAEELSVSNPHAYDVDDNGLVRLEWNEATETWDIYQATCPAA